MHRAAVVLLSATVLLSACSGSDGPSLPAAADFSAGTCTVAAPDVLAVGKALPELGDGPKVAREVKDALRDAQDGLKPLAENAEPTLKQALEDLVVSIGIVRIRSDGNTYEPALRTTLQKSYDSVLTACGVTV